jgi:predicted nucleic acid-binding protein
MIEAVIDASVVLRWAFEDEADRVGAMRVEQALRDARLHAVEPPLFLLEVAAALERGIRERRIDRPRSDAVMGALGLVAFEEVDPHEFAAVAFGLALATGLRVPDAAYVEVARVREATLITADRRQLEAAELLGVPVVALSDLPPW